MNVNSDVGALCKHFHPRSKSCDTWKPNTCCCLWFPVHFLFWMLLLRCAKWRLTSGSTSTNNLGVLTRHEWAFSFPGWKFFVERSEFTLWLWMFCFSVGVWESCHFTPARKALHKLDSESCFQTGQNKFAELRTSRHTVCKPRSQK